MQTVSCPGCGAPVEFKSHASVMAVCGFCQTTVLKDAGAVKDLGKMSAVLEDFSPIQIGTTGVAGTRPFTVVGRIQLRYSAGMWNEWYILFDDGSSSWLGDSSGLFTLTTEIKVEGELPTFDETAQGKQFNIGSSRMMVSEKRVADCIGGQGELPFKVGDGWQARVVDMRKGGQFVTLDYSDGERPAVYNGVSVTLEEMKCQLLREDEQIKESAGKYRGKLSALDCPNCGTGIKYLPGITSNLVCPSCATQVDASGPKAQVVEAGKVLERFRPTINLGAKAKINGVEHQVIGAMVRADEDGTEWTEYLVYNPRNAFFWLVETPEGWWRANVMPVWPAWSFVGADHVTLDSVEYKMLYQYQATVRFAAGAFNWRVAAGDVVNVVEFEKGQTRLAAEITPDELTWSRSTPLAFDQVKAWFGAEVDPNAIDAGAKKPASDTTTKFLWWILGLNLIPMMVNFGGTFIFPLMAALAIWLPAKFMGDDKK